jgi:DNA-binding MarR family transcriptional regulator
MPATARYAAAMAEQVPARLRQTVSWWLAAARIRSRGLTAEQLKDAGVRHSHYSVMATIVEVGPASQAALGRLIGLDRSDMVAVLNDLAAEGYVERNPDPGDRRRNVIRITPAGRNALRRFDKLVAAADAELLSPLSATEREQLRELLERVATGPGHAHPAALRTPRS